MRKTTEMMIVYAIGALGYGLLEILWRGYTHWSMLATGGLCFLLIYQSNARLPNRSVLVMGLISTVIVTSLELLVGSIVNLELKWDVWDYSGEPFNFMGQICLLYSFIWMLLGIPLSPFCRFLRKKVLKQPKAG